MNSVENQNTIGQILISLSQELNINKAVLGGISVTKIFVSPLGSQSLPRVTF
jgi:hypothetical protein